MMNQLSQFALTLPGSEEGIACAGTVVEKRTAKVRGKAFLFVDAKLAMLKLGASLPEAQRLAKQKPASCKAGIGGWVTVSLRPREAPPLTTLKRWIRESHGLQAAGSTKNSSSAKPAAKRHATPVAKKGAKPKR